MYRMNTDLDQGAEILAIQQAAFKSSDVVKQWLLGVFYRRDSIQLRPCVCALPAVQIRCLWKYFCFNKIGILDLIH